MNVVISSEDLAVLMSSDRLYAVFDVRERGEYNECQISNATSLPRSQIEFRIAELVPDPDVPIVVYDEGARRALLAAATLLRLGYQQVSILVGGLTAWEAEGQATVSGVNVPSKAFGERIHHERNIPDVTAAEIKSLQDQKANLLIVDVRTPEEYGRFCIPGGINVPGGDLILWVEELKQRGDATIIINCAGRTRSIIGTATLHRLGLTHARALKNGTMGWVLAGFDLEKQPARSAPPAPEISRETAATLARKLAEEEQISWTSIQDLGRLKRGMNYLIDVRSEVEYAAGHLPGSVNVPGGQAVQRADDFVAVRNAPIVFISNESTRAAMAAYWYRQMGFSNVMVLHGGLRAWTGSGGSIEIGAVRKEPLELEAAKRITRHVDARTLEDKMRDGSLLILDVGTSLEFEAGHVPGAKWLSRGWLELKLPESEKGRNQSIVLTCPDARQSALAALSLAEMGYTDVMVLDGGVRAWSLAGLPVEQGMEGCIGEPNDAVLSPSIRGTKEDMQRYLDWELKLQK